MSRAQIRINGTVLPQPQGCNLVIWPLHLLLNLHVGKIALQLRKVNITFLMLGEITVYSQIIS